MTGAAPFRNSRPGSSCRTAIDRSGRGVTAESATFAEAVRPGSVCGDDGQVLALGGDVNG
jgi:hypothetical protein